MALDIIAVPAATDHAITALSSLNLAPFGSDPYYDFTARESRTSSVCPLLLPIEPI